MKWQSRKPPKSVIEVWREWHSCFAWLPTVIPEQTADSIVVPRHWLWLERYDRRRAYDHEPGYWRWRSYTGAPTLRELRWKR